MAIRIPPGLNRKVVLPVETLYNLYFGKTPESEDDEMMQIYTNDLKKIHLYSNTTRLNDFIVN